MSTLIGLIVAACLTVAYYFWRRPTLNDSRTEGVAFACLYCLTLGLALRFGGRTYPGLHFPDALFLNSLLNGNGLFTGIGYLAVVVAWSAEVVHLILRASIRGIDFALRMVKWAAIGVAVAISIYGFVLAAIMQRLA